MREPAEDRLVQDSRRRQRHPLPFERASRPRNCYAIQRQSRRGGGLRSSLARRARLHRHARLLRRPPRSEEHTSELQSRVDLVCRLLLEKKKILFALAAFMSEQRTN